MGRDERGGDVPSEFNLFQSTRPHGARPPLVPSAYISRESFNPRARMGRDVIVPHKTGRYEEVSIHAPAWGAT